MKIENNQQLIEFIKKITIKSYPELKIYKPQEPSGLESFAPHFYQQDVHGSISFDFIINQDNTLFSKKKITDK